MMTHIQRRIEQLQFDDDIYNTIRHNIKKYRKEKGMTSTRLAEMVEFYKISVALDVSLDSLIEKQ